MPQETNAKFLVGMWSPLRELEALRIIISEIAKVKRRQMIAMANRFKCQGEMRSREAICEIKKTARPFDDTDEETELS